MNNDRKQIIEPRKKSLELQNTLKIDKFYIEFFLPAIPSDIIQNSTIEDLALLLKNLVHLTGKQLVGERSILDNKLAYKNISITQNKKITKRKAA
ncbi:MAG: hypothetical protein IPL26_11010 [Leptospiraceae bacterium]|nr:hypothetical protein [Leptospiraceae bacterium]